MCAGAFRPFSAGEDRSDRYPGRCPGPVPSAPVARKTGNETIKEEGMKLNVGLIGLGRLGKVYARDLAGRVAGVRLAALADTNAKLAEETARGREGARRDPRAFP